MDATDAPARRADPDQRRRALVAGCVGNLVEWYDFALFGAFATVIATTFFPYADDAGGLIGAFGAFGVAFLARPAGALLFGHYGDRYGRRRALAAGIVLMAVVTGGIGALPGYARIGWMASLSIMVLRLSQGVAVGGEYGGSAALVVEYAAPHRRGWYGGWQWATVGGGFLLGVGAAAVLSAVLSPSALASWGWRVPFFVAVPLGLVGLYVRTRLDETPAFLAAQQTRIVSRAPLADLVRTHRRRAAIGFVVVAAITVSFNVVYVFLPAYLAAEGRVALRDVLPAAAVGLALASAVAPAFGLLSDRIGRRPLLLGGLSALAVAVVPASTLIGRGEIGAMVAGYAAVSVPLGALSPTAFLAELFPTAVRYSGLSVTYGLGSAVFGGTAPLLAAILSQRVGDPSVAFWYAACLTAVAAVGALRAPETAHDPLEASE